MTSKKSLLNTILLSIILIISITNFFFIKKNQEAILETRKSLSNTISFIDSILEQQQASIEQEEYKQELDSVQASTTGIKASDFSFKDQNGKVTSLESLGNKKKLLIFSSAECETCKEFYPELDLFYKKLNKNTLSLAVLQVGSSQEENKKTIEKNNYSFNFLNANEGVFDDYQVATTPTGILLDETNTIINTSDLLTYSDIVDFIKASN